jgi:exonuclease 3'-5' domain-containing protein 2
VQLYATLEYHRKQLDPCPPTPHFAELNLAIPLADEIKLTDPDETKKNTEVEPLEECASGSLDDSEQYLVQAFGVLSIEYREAAAPVYVTTQTKRNLMLQEKRKTTTVATKSPQRPKDSRVEVAEDRATSYRASHPKTTASLPHLRAYYLWHCYGLPPANIAQLLRDPPLKTATVAQYILSVVQSETLPVDHDELRELAGFVAQSTLRERWPVVATMVSTGRG